MSNQQQFGSAFSAMAKDLPNSIASISDRMRELISTPFLSENFLRRKVKDYAQELRMLQITAKEVASYVEALEIVLYEKGGTDEQD